MNMGPDIACKRFFDACKNGDVKSAKQELCVKGLDPAKAAGQGHALQLACENGHYEVVKMLLAMDCFRETATAYTNYALRLAAQKGSLPNVQLLLTIPEVLSALINETDHDDDALQMAAQFGRLDIVEYLLNFTVNINGSTVRLFEERAAVNHNAALRRAVFGGFDDIARILLRYEAVKNIAGVHGNFTLIWAAQRGLLEVVKTLLNLDSVHRCLNASNALDTLAGAIDCNQYSVVAVLLSVDAFQECLRENKYLIANYKNFFEELIKKTKDLDHNVIGMIRETIHVNLNITPAYQLHVNNSAAACEDAQSDTLSNVFGHLKM